MSDNVGSIKYDASIDTQGIRRDAKKIEDAIKGSTSESSTALNKMAKSFNVDMSSVSGKSFEVRSAFLQTQVAQESLSSAIAKYGKDSFQAQKASLDLEKAQYNLRDANDSAGDSFSGLGKVAKVGMATAAAAVAAGVALIGSHIGDAVKRVDTLERFPKVMENMGFSASDAESQVKRMADSLKGLPTSLDAITTFVSRVAPMSGGVKKATDVALAFNNAVLAGGGPIYRQADAIEQFSQMLGKGIPDMAAWRTLQEAMPATLSQVAKSMGIASGDTTKLYEALQSGKFSMQDFSDEIIKLNEKGLPGYKNFAEQAKDATQGIQTGWENFNISITRGVADIIQSIGSANISNAISNIGAGLENGLKGFGQFIKDIQPGIKMFNDALGWMWQQFKPIFDSISANKPLLDFISSFFAALATIVGGTLVAAFGLAVGAVVVVIGIFEALRNVGLFLGDVIYNVATFFVNAWNAIVGAWSAAVGWFNGVVGGIRGAFSAIPGIISGVFSSAWGAATGVWNGAASWFGGIVNGIIGWFARLPGQVGSFAQGAWNSLVGAFTGAASIGSNIIRGIVSGLNPGPIIARMKEIASSALDTVKSFLGIHSPSRVFRDQVGKQIGAGMALGISDSASLVSNSALKLSNGLIGTFDNITSPTLGIDGTGSISGSVGGRSISMTNTYIVNNQADAEIISRKQAYAMGAV